MLARIAQVVLQALEILTIAILSVLALLALGGIIVEIPNLARPPFLDTVKLSPLLDHLLAVFVLIELLVVAVAFLRGSDRVRRIFEASLVALARKLISTETMGVAQTGALAMLLVAIGVTWFLISKGEAAKR